MLNPSLPLFFDEVWSLRKVVWEHNRVQSEKTESTGHTKGHTGHIMLMDLFQGTDLCDCESWSEKSEIRRVGCQKRQVGSLRKG